MKKSIFLFPLLAAWLLIASGCDYSDSSDYQPSRHSNINTEEITDAVNRALAEAFENAGFNDTILNCNTMAFTDPTMVMTMNNNAFTSGLVNMPEIKININNDDSQWIDLQDHKLKMKGMIAIFSIVIPCFMILVVAAFILLFFYFRMKNRNKVIEAAIAAGYELPAEFYTGTSANAGNQSADERAATAEPGTVPPPLPRNERLRTHGMRLVAIGIGMMIMLGVWGGLDAAVLGIIPLLIGASSLAGYYNLLK